MSRHYGHRSRDFRYGETQYKHFRNGKLIKPEEDPFMHFQQRKSFFADNPNLDEVAQTVSPDSFNDDEYEELLSKYSDGGAYSSHGQAVESRRHVQNVKEKINSMKKKFQSLALVCDYVEGVEKYEHALETDPDSKMVKELTTKLETLKSAPKVHTNEHSYAVSSSAASTSKQYGVSLADKRRQKAIAAAKQVSSSASSRSQSRASSPCRGGHGGGNGSSGSQSGVPSIRLRETVSPSRLQHFHQEQQQQHSPRSSSPHLRPGSRSIHCASPSRFASVTSRSRNSSTCRPDTRDASTQVGRSRISSDSEDEKYRDSGVCTHDEDEERGKIKKKLDNRLKKELLKPKFYLNDSGNLVRVNSDDSIADNDNSDNNDIICNKNAPEGLPPPAPKAATNSVAEASTFAPSSNSPTTALLHIYYDLVSSACRALFLFLKMSSTEFEGHLVQLRSGDQFQPEFAELSPARRLPVMEEGGFVLREAIAICRYVADLRNLPGQWRADGGVAGGNNYNNNNNGGDPFEQNNSVSENNDENQIGGGGNSSGDHRNDDHDNENERMRARARVDEYLSWHQGHLRPTCLQLFTQATLTPILTGKPPDFRRLKALKTELDNHCQFMETVFLNRGDFIGGEEIGICDLFAICELMQPYAAGFDVRQSPFRRLRQWVERVKRETRPFFDEAHAEIIKIWETKGRYIIDDYDDFVRQ